MIDAQHRKDKEKKWTGSNNRCLLLCSYLSRKKFLLYFYLASQLKFFFKAFSMPAFLELFLLLMKRVMYASEKFIF